MPIINAGRFAVEVQIITTPTQYGLLGGVSSTLQTKAGPETAVPLLSGGMGKRVAPWPQGATTRELYDFDRAVDALLIAAGVPETLRKHSGLWGKNIHTVDYDFARRQILAARPDLDTAPRNLYSLAPAMLDSISA